jgi:hypothetical protein
MLRVVTRTFEADHGIILVPGDIVDASYFKHAKALKESGYLADTDATKATVDVSRPKEGYVTEREASTASASAKTKQPTKRMKRSALASRPRVFTRKA